MMTSKTVSADARKTLDSGSSASISSLPSWMLILVLLSVEELLLPLVPYYLPSIPYI